MNWAKDNEFFLSEKKFYFFSEWLDFLQKNVTRGHETFHNIFVMYFYNYFSGLGKGRKFAQTKGGSRKAATKSRDSLKLRRKR